MMQPRSTPMQFDPYLEWLEIPASCRPPNHYDLLGLAVFEPRDDIIFAAALERIALVPASR